MFVFDSLMYSLLRPGQLTSASLCFPQSSSGNGGIGLDRGEQEGGDAVNERMQLSALTSPTPIGNANGSPSELSDIVRGALATPTVGRESNVAMDT